MSELHNHRINTAEYQAIAALSSIFSLRMLGLFMILPVFALYARELRDVTPTRVGLALGIYGLTQALLQIPFGYLSDRIGRKPVIIMGLLLFCIGSIVAAMSESIGGIILGRSLQGAGAIGSVTLALLTDLTRSEVRLRAMAVLGITIALSFGLAFVLGPLLTAKWGVPGIFWLSALLAMAGIVVLQSFVPKVGVTSTTPQSTLHQSNQTESKNHLEEKKSRLNSTTAAKSVCLKSVPWLSAALCNLYFGTLVIHASLTALFLKIPGMVHGLGFQESETWQFYLPVFVIALISTVPLILFLERNTRVFERKSIKARQPSQAINLEVSTNHLKPEAAFAVQTSQSKPGMVLFFIVSALLLSEVLLAFGGTALFGLALAMWLFFTMFNVLEASLPASISKLAPSNQKGVALGIFSTMQFLGLFLGGLLGGVLDSMGGEVAVLSFCVILALVWLVCIFWLNHLRGN